MKILKLLMIICCFLLVGCGKIEPETEKPNVDNEQVDDNQTIEDSVIEEPIDENREPINIYLFWGDGCHVCENLKKYFSDIEEEYGKYYNLIEYEVWFNEENKELMMKVGEELNQTYYAVPYLVIGDEIIVGYSVDKDVEIINTIINNYNNDNYVDRVEQIKIELN